MRRLTASALLLLVVALLVGWGDGGGGLPGGRALPAATAQAAITRSHAQTAGTKHHRNRLVVFSHSYSLWPPNASWAQVLADRKNLKLDNRGAGGIESALVALSVLAYKPRASDTVVIEPFLNDVRRFGTVQAGLRSYRQSLTLMLDHLASGVRPKAVVILEDPPIRDWHAYPPFDHGSLAAEAAYRKVTARTVAPYSVIVANAASRWDVASMIGPDGVHPTKAGAASIARSIVARLAGASAAR